MSHSKPDFSAMVGSRICHDLISPVGAIGNGVELIGMGGFSGPEIELISDSVDNASARIRFFRIAFGMAGAEQLVGSPEVRSILEDLSAGGRMTYVWEVSRDVERPYLRAAFLALMCLETALPLGGQISVSKAGDRWNLRAEGTKLAVNRELWADLTRPSRVVEITPGRVQFGLLPQVVADLGRELGVVCGDESVEISF